MGVGLEIGERTSINENSGNIEKKVEEEANTTFKERIVRDWSIIKKAFSQPALYRFQLFVIISGLIQPLFTTY